LPAAPGRAARRLKLGELHPFTWADEHRPRWWGRAGCPAQRRKCWLTDIGHGERVRPQSRRRRPEGLARGCRQLDRQSTRRYLCGDV